MSESTQKFSLPPLPSVGALFRSTFLFWKSHLALIIGISLVPFLLSVVQIAIVETGDRTLASLWSLITIMVSLLAYLALFYAVSREGTFAGGVAGSLREAIKVFMSFLWLEILLAVALVGGYALFVIPGIFLSIAMSFAPFAFIVEGKRGITALAASWHYARGYWWGILLRLLALVLLAGLVSLVVTLAVVTIQPGPLQAKEMAGSAYRYGSSQFENPSPLLLVVNNALSSLFVTPISIIFLYFLYKALVELKGRATREALLPLEQKTTYYLGVGVVTIFIVITLSAFVFISYGPKIMHFRQLPGVPFSIFVESL
ncbi:MAG: hypothetical protein Q7S15_00320 [bacterium]|nr:hypothetical protein [bacterium]